MRITIGRTEVAIIEIVGVIVFVVLIGWRIWIR